MKESTMIDKIAYQHIEKPAKKAKSSEESMEVVNEIEKKLEVINAVFYS